MSSAALDRRLRKLETATGSEDIRHYLHRPLVEWPDHILQLGIEMGDEELAKLMADLPDWSGCESQQPADPDENVWKRKIEGRSGANTRSPYLASALMSSSTIRLETTRPCTSTSGGCIEPVSDDGRAGIRVKIAKGPAQI